MGHDLSPPSIVLYCAGERTGIVTQNEYDNPHPSNRVRKDTDARAISRLSDLHFPPKLTRRESEILPLLLAGSTRDEIASSLSVSPETVKLHTRNILSKFGATTVRDGFYNMNLYQFITEWAVREVIVLRTCFSAYAKSCQDEKTFGSQTNST